ncbi:MAG: hypothetical protein UY64_C0022G0016, partial [Parcubacteria group bacterium GW2011_GWA1_51_12]
MARPVIPKIGMTGGSDVFKQPEIRGTLYLKSI